MSLFQKILIFFFIFIFVCLIYSALMQIQWTVESATIIGNIILGFCTLSGAALVIVAAKIQAGAIRDQVNEDKNEKLRLENMQYFGWFMTSLQDLKRCYMNDRFKAKIFEDFVARGGIFSGQTSVDTTDWFRPNIFIVGPDARHLYAKLPEEIALFLAGGDAPHHDINNHIFSLKFLLLQRPTDTNAISMEAAKVIDAYTTLLKKYEDGFKLVEPHVKNLIGLMKKNSVKY